MRQCPNCNEKTIATKWLLINKSNSKTKYCFECPNCNTKIRKQKKFFLDLITVDIFTLGVLVFILTISIKDNFPSLTFALIISVLSFTILYFGIEYFAKLKIAEEDYCLGGMSRKGAFFALIFMCIIICMTIYCLVIQPFILNVPSCS